MRKKIAKIAFSAGFGLALTFVLSCSSENKDPAGCSDAVTGNGTMSCGGQIYQTVKIGDQIWMAQNLNYNVENSRCYKDELANCDKYGRLYDWATAMDFPSKCDSNSANNEACFIKKPHQGICPIGWHIPSNEEWDKLYRFADNTRYSESPYESPTAGKYLKAQTGWTSCGPSGSGKNYLCEDTYGFSAAPGGGGFDGLFNHAGFYGYWWTANEFNSTRAYSRYIESPRDTAYWSSNNHGRGKTILISVRCLRN
jgi:uncharacterized protein (TIGR02145 family)